MSDVAAKFWYDLQPLIVMVFLRRLPAICYRNSIWPATGSRWIFAMKSRIFDPEYLSKLISHLRMSRDILPKRNFVIFAYRANNAGLSSWQILAWVNNVVGFSWVHAGKMVPTSMKQFVFISNLLILLQLCIVKEVPSLGIHIELTKIPSPSFHLKFCKWAA